MKYSLTKVNPHKAALVSGIWLGCMSLIFVPFVLLVSFVSTKSSLSTGPLMSFGPILAIFIPIFYGGVGYISMYTFCSIYNFMATKNIHYEFSLAEIKEVDQE